MKTQLTTTALAATALGVFATSAHADSTFTIRGAGFGHGVGMSQYGAYGYARKGVDHRSILAHYYTGTQLGGLPGSRRVRVLLQTGAGQRSFSGATRAAGRRISSSRTYGVRPNASGTLTLLSPTGRRMKTVKAPLRVSGGTPTVRGRTLDGRPNARYRGRLEYRVNGSRGADTINSVSLEHYVQGVVPLESPAKWPQEALKAQAVAARTYAVTTSKSGRGWDHYPDVRSQVYGGVGAEQPSTNTATRATRGQVVTYQGQPVTTYFFSTSGGKTENVENTTLGNRPLPWLRSVEDPYDDLSPKHRWGPIRMSMATADRKLGSLVKGSFEGIEVARRGASPRIISAVVVGSGGRTTTDGATLRKRLGLNDTWAYFTTVASSAAKPSRSLAARAAGLPSGDAAFQPIEIDASRPTSQRRAVGQLTGRITPARALDLLTVQRRSAAGRWTAIGLTQTRTSGRFRYPIFEPGRYRVHSGEVTGPVVRFRSR